MDTRGRRRLVRRFTVTERALHWLMAGAFLGMLVTGVVMGASRTALLALHLGLAAVLVAGVGALMLAGDRRALRATVRQLRRLDALDRRWLRQAPRSVIDGSPLPPAGRFNAGQKMNARLVLAGMTALYVTGVAQFLPGPLAGLHGAAAGLMVVLVAGHVYMAAVNPRTRHGLRGMTLGSVDREWAAHHHPRWVTELDGGGEPVAAEPVRR